MAGMTELLTPRDVIAALGGPTKTARLLGREPNVVCNWLKRGFPAETYLIFLHHLRQRRLSAPPHLWNMQLP